jgi:hypothetical protein
MLRAAQRSSGAPNDVGTVRITLVAAFCHMLGIGEHGGHLSHFALLLVVLSITVPAIGGAVHGVATQREYRGHSERSTWMTELLTRLQLQMDNAENLDQARETAASTERLL